MNSRNIFIIAIFIIQYFPLSYLFADEIYLKKNDKITRTILKENDYVVVVESEAMGKVSIKKEFVEHILTDEMIQIEAVQEEPGGIWTREISVGYNKTSGNTQNSQLFSKLFIHRKTNDNEFHLQGEGFYSS